MTRNFIFFLMLTVVSMIACKHKHVEASSSLKEAYKIQISALEIIKEIDKLLDTSDFSNIPQKLLDRRHTLVTQMIEIPGMDHDHANCNHDHRPTTFKITDEQMIEVQSVWKDSLTSIKQEIMELLTSPQ